MSKQLSEVYPNSGPFVVRSFEFQWKHKAFLETTEKLEKNNYHIIKKACLKNYLNNHRIN